MKNTSVPYRNFTSDGLVKGFLFGFEKGKKSKYR